MWKSLKYVRQAVPIMEVWLDREWVSITPQILGPPGMLVILRTRCLMLMKSWHKRWRTCLWRRHTGPSPQALRTERRAEK